MAVTIPNLSDAAYPAQAFPNSVDLAILSDGLAGNGIVSGCNVTAQASPNMTVHVAAGSILSSGASVAVSAVDPVVSAASANPRRDLVVINAAGTVSVVAGTPEPVVVGDPSVVPRLPAVPSGSVAIASLEVPGGASAISNAQILDKRAVLVTETTSVSALQLIARKTSDQSVTSSTTLVNDTALVLPVSASTVWQFEVTLLAEGGGGGMLVGFTFPAAGRLSARALWQVASTGTMGSTSGTTTPTGSFVSIAAANLGATPNYSVVNLWGVFTNSTTAGNLTLQWAQQSSSGTATTVKANSTLWGVQLA